MRRARGDRLDRVSTAVADLDVPPAVFKTCPRQPRALVEIGLRQWLRCRAPELRDRQIIGMPSRAVDEAWYGLILCTARYSRFCPTAYGEFLHHHPDGGAPADVAALTDSVDEQLRRTVIAWSLVAAQASIVSCGISTNMSVSTSPGVWTSPGSRRSRTSSHDCMRAAQTSELVATFSPRLMRRATSSINGHAMPIKACVL